MVSKARLDLPLPLGPVMTVNLPSGRSRSIPLRLFWRAPRTSTQPRSGGAVTQGLLAVVEPTGDYPVERLSSQIFDVKNPVIPRRTDRVFCSHCPVGDASSRQLSAARYQFARISGASHSESGYSGSTSETLRYFFPLRQES